MATYIPQVQAYVPQYQPFQPDFNFYSSALQMKQSQYDAAHKQLSTLYSSLLNSPLTRDSNVEKKDKIFDMINQNIKKISAMDLSLQQNVTAARKVFDPIYEDDNLIKDMTWTKNYMNALQRADSFKGCNDPKKCGGQYWETGVDYLNYKRNEFKNASDAEALSFEDVSYTPFQNVHEKAVKLAKEAGLNVTQDFNTGDWIVTKQNGDLVQGGLYDLFSNALGSDPTIQAMYDTGAYVKRKSYVSTRVASGIDENTAELEYINSILAVGNKAVQEQSKNVNRASDEMAARRNELLQKQRDGSLTYKDLAALNEINEKYPQLSKTKENLETVNNTINNTNSGTDIKTLRARADAAAAHVLASYDFTQAAQTLALKDAKLTLKENPYRIATLQADLSLRNSMQMASINYENKIKEMMAKNKLDMEKKQFEYQLEEGMFDNSFLGGLANLFGVGGPSGGAGGNARIVEDVPGTSAPLTGEDENLPAVYDKNTEIAKGLEGTSRDMMIKFLLDFYEVAQQSGTPGAKSAIERVFSTPTTELKDDSSLYFDPEGYYLKRETRPDNNYEYYYKDKTPEQVKTAINLLVDSPVALEKYYNKAVEELTKQCPTCDMSWSKTFLKKDETIEIMNAIPDKLKAAQAVTTKVKEDIEAIVKSVSNQKGYFVTDDYNTYSDADLTLENGYLTDESGFVKNYIKRHENDSRYDIQNDDAGRSWASQTLRSVLGSVAHYAGAGFVSNVLDWKDTKANENNFNRLYKETGNPIWKERLEDLAKTGYYKGQQELKSRFNLAPLTDGSYYFNDIVEDAKKAYKAISDKIFVDYNSASSRNIPLDQGFGLEGSGTLTSRTVIQDVDGRKGLHGSTIIARQELTELNDNNPMIGSESFKVGFGAPTKSNIVSGDDEAVIKTALSTIAEDMSLPSRHWKSDMKKRPLFEYGSSKIALDNVNMSSRTVKLKDTYLKKLVGSEKSPGILWEYKDKVGDGMFFAYDNRKIQLPGDLASQSTDLDYIARFDPKGIEVNVPNGGYMSIKIDKNTGKIIGSGYEEFYVQGKKIKDPFTFEKDPGEDLATLRNGLLTKFLSNKNNMEALDNTAIRLNQTGVEVPGYVPVDQNTNPE